MEQLKALLTNKKADKINDLERCTVTETDVKKTNKRREKQ
jgi:hypothetical protein